MARAFGGPEALALEEIPTPEPGPDEVRVSMRAIGVNPIDYKRYGGTYGNSPSLLPMAIGFEGAGVVSAVGAAVTEFTVGDEVIAYPARGTYTDELIAHPRDLVHKPAGLDWNVAAGLMLAGCTAIDCLETVDIHAGDVVLVHGASGAVGSVAAQVAIERGATVLGTGSAANQEYIASLGATALVYGSGLTERIEASGVGPITAVIDTVGHLDALETTRVVRPDLTRVVSAAGGPEWVALGIPRIGGPDSDARRRGFRDGLARLAVDGKVTVLIAQTLPLEQAATAHAEIARSHPPGKYILLP